MHKTTAAKRSCCSATLRRNNAPSDTAISPFVVSARVAPNQTATGAVERAAIVAVAICPRSAHSDRNTVEKDTLAALRHAVAPERSSRRERSLQIAIAESINASALMTDTTPTGMRV